MYQSIHSGSDIDNCIVLSKKEENHKQGLRLLSSPAANHGNIGTRAIDLSYQTEASETTGTTGDYSVCLGVNTTSASLYSFSSGIYNIGLLDTLIEVGTGVSQWNRKNAFEIYKDGKVRAPELTLEKINTPKSLVTKEYVEDLIINSSSSQLEQILQNEKIGWKLLSYVTYNFAETGQGSINLSFSDSDTKTIPTGAPGNYSFSSGYFTISQNDNQVTFGKFNTGVSTETIFELGIGTSDIDRKNALEIFEDGTITAPQSTHQFITARGLKALITAEFLNNKISQTSLLDFADTPDIYGNTGETLVLESNSGQHSFVFKKNVQVLSDLEDVSSDTPSEGDLLISQSGIWTPYNILDAGEFS